MTPLVVGQAVTDGAGARGIVTRVETIPCVPGRAAQEVAYVDWQHGVCPECNAPVEVRSGRLVCSDLTCFWRYTP